MPYSKQRRALAECGIGGILRTARLRRGHSQADLANSVGMSASSVSHIESGSDLKTSTLLRMVAECDCEVVIVPKEALRVIHSVMREMDPNQRFLMNEGGRDE